MTIECHRIATMGIGMGLRGTKCKQWTVPPTLRVDGTTQICLLAPGR